MPKILIANNTKELSEALATVCPDILVLNVDPSALSGILQGNNAETPDPIIRRHLLALNIPQARKGFQYLCIGIQLFAQDPEQSLTKELYPAIAKALGYGSAAQVERSIRTAILSAWQQRNASAWDQYFPGTSSVPTNKHFLCAIAQMIR